MDCIFIENAHFLKEAFLKISKLGKVNMCDSRQNNKIGNFVPF